MKKIAFVIISFLCFMHGVSGQDTLYSLTPPSRYLLDQWKEPDTVNWADYVARFMFAGGFASAEETAYSFVTNDTLTVYGMAASMVIGSDFSEYSHKYTYEYLKLYQYHDNNMQQKGESFYVHPDETPVAYYYYPDPSLGYSPSSMSIFPVYEYMFDTPQTVIDTFFIGHTELTQSSSTFIMIDGEIVPSLNLLTLIISGGDQTRWPERMFAVKDTDEYNVVKWSIKPDHIPYSYISYYLFPILVPDSTSAGGGGDTTQSIQKNMLERYTHVFPNPATERVQVLSSFGLTHLEAYDADGRRVAEREASGLEATLDVTAWPRGTYLLRITTPVGTVTKKLLVQ